MLALFVVLNFLALSEYNAKSNSMTNATNFGTMAKIVDYMKVHSNALS